MPPDQASAEPPGWETIEALFAALESPLLSYALRLAGDKKALDFRVEKLDDLARLLAAKRRERFSYAEKLVKDKDVLRQTLFIWLSYWRDVLLKTSGAQAALTNADRAEEIEALACRVDLPLARRIAADLENAIERLEKNVNARLLAEVTLLDWPVVK